MSVSTGTATSVSDLLTKLDAFLQVGHALDPVYTGTGNGTITNLIGTAASVLETITVTLTGAAGFNVAGSVSGALGAGTVGVAFACAVCSFTLVAGGTPWANADTVAFTMTPKWINKRTARAGSGTDEYIWQAPGNDGTSQIFVGVLRFTDVTGDYDNLRLGGFNSYSAGPDFYTQPGALTRAVLPLLRVGSMPYWFSANGRRVVIVAKCSTVYEAAYLGFIAPYINPTQYPYPLLVGGSQSWQIEPGATSTNWRWSYQGGEHRAFPMAGNGPNADYNNFQTRLRKVDGTWLGLGGTVASISAASLYVQGYLWPFTGAGFDDVRANLDGSYPLFPVVLSEDAGYLSGYSAAHYDTLLKQPNVFGELDGVYAVPGHGNAAENTITINRITHLVVQNIFRNQKYDYFAVKLA